jgi:flagellar basal body-associated protein FliL
MLFAISGLVMIIIVIIIITITGILCFSTKIFYLFKKEKKSTNNNFSLSQTKEIDKNHK